MLLSIKMRRNNYRPERGVAKTKPRPPRPTDKNGGALSEDRQEQCEPGRLHGNDPGVAVEEESETDEGEDAEGDQDQSHRLRQVLQSVSNLSIWPVH